MRFRAERHISIHCTSQVDIRRHNVDGGRPFLGMHTQLLGSITEKLLLHLTAALSSQTQHDGRLATFEVGAHAMSSASINNKPSQALGTVHQLFRIRVSIDEGGVIRPNRSVQRLVSTDITAQPELLPGKRDTYLQSFLADLLSNPLENFVKDVSIDEVG